MLVDQGLIGEETVRNLLTWRHSGVWFHHCTRFESPDDLSRDALLSA